MYISAEPLIPPFRGDGQKHPNLIWTGFYGKGGKQMFYLIVQPILIAIFFMCFMLLMLDGENKPSERNYKGLIRVMAFSFIGAIVMLYFK
ncbi:hypothetical protein CN446_30910 [Bacillus cereus]|nr:hypothetical protein CN446_30910 [Bacillus cereus]PGU57109.1 hypothetical protein COD70_15245 [Bacillus cereus]